MDRRTVYPGAIPLESDLLFAQRAAMVAVGTLGQATLSQGTYLDGLACSPTVPASMTLSVGPGMISQPTTLDSTAFSTLPLSSDPLTKFGINLSTTQLTFVAPTAAGLSQAFLIQVQFTETDADPVSLPYFNAAKPSVAFSGPNNSGVAQNTTRKQRVAIQVKAGVQAATGSQAAPTADAGWSPAWVVTIANGTTTLTSANVAVAPGAPFLRHRIVQLSNQLSTVIAAAGITINPLDDGQTLAALQTLIAGAGRKVAYSTPGTYSFTVLAGVYWVRVGVIGAGGGGCGCKTNANSVSGAVSGAGGGAGGLAVGIYAVTPGQVITVVVGAGGGTQSAGGSSSFGAFCSAAGGAGGAFINATLNCPGGAGGNAFGGTLVNQTGGYGSDGQSGTLYFTGNGAPGPRGGAGRAGAFGGLGATGPGAGGGGAYDGAGNGILYTGGAGGGGEVLVEY